MSATAEDVKARAANSALPTLAQIRAANIQHQGAVTKEQEAHNIQRHNKLKAEVEAAIKLLQSTKIMTDAISKQFFRFSKTLNHIPVVAYSIYLTNSRSENEHVLLFTFEEFVTYVINYFCSSDIIKELLQQGMLPNMSIPTSTSPGGVRISVPKPTTSLCLAIKAIGDNTMDLSEKNIIAAFTNIEVLLNAGATFDKACLETLTSSLRSLKTLSTKVDFEIISYLTSLLISKATVEVANLVCSRTGETINESEYFLSFGSVFLHQFIAPIQERIAAACSGGYVLLEIQRTACFAFAPLCSRTILDYYYYDEETQILKQAGYEFARHFTPLANQTGSPLTPDLFYKIFRSTRVIRGSTELICKIIECSTFSSIFTHPEYTTTLGNRKKWDEEQYLAGNPDNTIRKLANNIKMEQEQQFHRYICTRTGAPADPTILHLYPSAEPNYSLISVTREAQNPQDPGRYHPEPNRFFYLHRGLSICIAWRQYQIRAPHYLVLEEDAERNPNRNTPFRMPS